MLWPSTIQFSPRYFESLMKHAVPLNETAIARLSHNAMALDVYTWLAQRLHRVEEAKGGGRSLDRFARAVWPWLRTVAGFSARVPAHLASQVKAVYPESKFELTRGGMTLRHSRSPVGKRLLPMSREN